MKNSLLVIGLIAVMGVSVLGIGAAIALRRPLPFAVEAAQKELEIKQVELSKARIDAAIQAIPVWRKIHYGAAVGVSISGLFLAAGFGLERVRRASVYMAKIGQYSEFPVHIRQIKSGELTPQLATLTAAEQLERMNAGQEKIVQALESVIETGTAQMRVIAAQSRAALTAGHAALPEAPALPVNIPTFHDMLHQGAFNNQSKLIMGFNSDGVPQLRGVEDIKAISVAGWQGSGKTLSTAYLVASILLQHDDSLAYIIDPHAQHAEGLGSLLKPLADTGRLTLVNPAESAGLIIALNGILDQRLRGEVPSSPIIVLVIDEMSSIGKTDLFLSHILPFVERCTAETRKAGIVFVGCSPKWQAKHFGGHADIRQSFPSLLIHKIKPSQANLLLEDAQEIKLVKQLTKSGQALLSTSHDADPMPVSMPLISRKDIEYISQHVVKKQVNGPLVDYVIDVPVDSVNTGQSGFVDFRNRLDQYCQNRGNFTKLVNDIGIDQGYLSRIRNGKQDPSPEWEQKITTYLDKRNLHVIQGGKS